MKTENIPAAMLDEDLHVGVQETLIPFLWRHRPGDGFELDTENEKPTWSRKTPLRYSAHIGKNLVIHPHARG